jgi:lysyl-tRNA synthetase class 2
MEAPEREINSSQEHDIRLEKIKKLREMGIEPWPVTKPVSATCLQAIEAFDKGDQAELSVAGRLMSIREHGKTIFCHIQDRSARMQVYIRQDEMGAESFAFFKEFIDVGDIVWFRGTVFKTKMGEITLKVLECSLLSKCLYPLPEKWHGLVDQEVRYRQRYLDLISNPESREKFKARSKIVSGIRNYLDAHGFMEVETPMLHPIPGGANAKPFVTHHNALHTDLYLRIAPELYLKRLVVGGFERVYEINRNFRNEGVSTRHNPEFTMLEFYMAHVDYVFMMEFVENMIRELVRAANGSLQVSYGDHVLDFEKPFAKISPREAVLKFGGLSENDLLEKNIDVTIDVHSVDPAIKKTSYQQKVFALFEKLAEPKLIQPTYITHFPVEISPLAKRDQNDPSIAARFELFVAGMELGNGFSELNDPFDQAERFKEQVKAKDAGDEEAQHYDADYVQALEYGLPPTCGVGIGIDRLTMLLTNTTSIRDVILFPSLKKKE